MITNTRREAEARLEQADVGPFVIRRKQLGGQLTYKTRARGWTQDLAAAWKFDTRAAAEVILRGNDGEVYRLDDAQQEAAQPVEAVLVPEEGSVELEPLTAAERSELERLEQEIATKMEDVGRALWKIRTQRLYKEKYRRWEDYIAERWGMSPRQSHRLIKGEETKQGMLLLTQGDAKLTKLVTSLKESQTRELAKLPEPGQQLQVLQTAAAGRAKTTAREISEAVAKALPAKQWPKPNESGVFVEKQCDTRVFSAAGCYAKIFYLEAEPGMWLSSFQFTFSSPPGGAGSRPSIGGPYHLSSDAAMARAAYELREAVKNRLRARGAKKMLPVEQDLVDWTHKFSETRKGAEADRSDGEDKSDKKGPWVVCRPPLPGATSPTATMARYSGPGWGWSPNPQKGKPYLNWHEANAEAQRHHDQVVSLQDALRPAPIQVKAHERARAGAQTWDETPLPTPVIPSAHDNEDTRTSVSRGIRDTMACLGALEELLGQLDDAVMRSNVQRSFSLLRPVLLKYAKMDNLRAERIDGQKKDPVLDARFHTIDAEVEASAALQLLQTGTPDFHQELYQAEQAVDHLKCLKALLTNGGVRKAKGKR